jgi:GT2 family glycosyltransferase
MLCWNRKDDVRESLTRIRAIEFPNHAYELIVVDNGSTDGTPEMVRLEFPEATLIRMPRNIGIDAYNVGFETARGEYLVVIDDDSFPAPQALSRMVDKFSRDERLGVVAFDVRNFSSYDDVQIMEEDGATETASASSSSSNRYLMSFNGAGVGIRRELFRRVGWYPEEFFLYNNEMDSAFRILDAGYKIEFFADVIAYHKSSPQNRASRRAPYYYVRNAFWLSWKNYAPRLALATTARLIYRCIYATFEQRTTVYLKALAAAFARIDKLRGKRKAVRWHIAENLRVPLDLFFTYYR